MNSGRFEGNKLPVHARLGHRTRSDYDQVRKISNSVFVSNFPSHFSIRELWVLCEKAGPVNDVFIAKKKTKQGRMFAFVQFGLSKPVEDIIRNLNGRWIGRMQLQANVERFERNSVPVRPRLQRDKVAPTPKVMGASNRKADVSYAAAVSGPKGGVEEHSVDVEVDQPIVLEVSAEAKERFPCSALVQVKEFLTMMNVPKICKGEGFEVVNCSFVGGLWVLVDLCSVVARNKFIEHAGINAWFASVRSWDVDFVVSERLVWLELEGIPLDAWSRDSMDKIVSRWGKVSFVDESDPHNLASVKVGILSSHSSFIRANLPVQVNGKVVSVRVRELSAWLPEFAQSDEAASGRESSYARCVEEVDSEEYEEGVMITFLRVL